MVLAYIFVFHIIYSLLGSGSDCAFDEEARADQAALLQNRMTVQQPEEEVKTIEYNDAQEDDDDDVAEDDVAQEYVEEDEEVDDNDEEESLMEEEEDDVEDVEEVDEYNDEGQLLMEEKQHHIEDLQDEHVQQPEWPPPCMVQRRRRFTNDQKASIPDIFPQPLPQLTVEMHFHLVPNFKITSSYSLGGLELDSWLTKEDLETFLDRPRGPNKVFADLNISFTLANISVDECVGLGTCNAEPTPTVYGTFTPECAKAIFSEINYKSDDQSDEVYGPDLPVKHRKNGYIVRDAFHSQIPKGSYDPSQFHVYFVPYNGRRSQGRANRWIDRGYISMGQWSDKYGTVSRRTLDDLVSTLTHEMGHQLGLGHSNEEQKITVPGRLMSNKVQRYDKTDYDAIQARCGASAKYRFLRETPKDNIPSELKSTPYAYGPCSGGTTTTLPPPMCDDRRKSCRRRSVKNCKADLCIRQCAAERQGDCTRSLYCDNQNQPCRRRRWVKEGRCTTTTTTVLYPLPPLPPPGPMCKPATAQTCRRRRWITCANCLKLPNAPAPFGTCTDPDPNTAGEEDYVCPLGYAPKDLPGGQCVDAASCNANCCEASPPLQDLGGEACNDDLGRKCQPCEGDCDKDSDCADGLLCFQRGSVFDVGDNKVPGCGFGGSGDVPGYDYCYDPTSTI